MRRQRLLGAAGGVVGAASAVLPWIEATRTLGSESIDHRAFTYVDIVTQSSNLASYLFGIFLVLGVVGAIWVETDTPDRLGRLQEFGGLGALLFTVVVFARIRSFTPSPLSGWEVSPGVGVYVAMLSGALLLLGAIAGQVQQR